RSFTFLAPKVMGVQIIRENLLDCFSDWQCRFSVFIKSFWLNTLHGDTGRFRPDNLLRRHDTMSQHFPYCSTGDVDPIFFIMLARLFRGKRITPCAMKYFVK